MNRDTYSPFGYGTLWWRVTLPVAGGDGLIPVVQLQADSSHEFSEFTYERDNWRDHYSAPFWHTISQSLLIGYDRNRRWRCLLENRAIFTYALVSRCICIIYASFLTMVSFTSNQPVQKNPRIMTISRNMETRFCLHEDLTNIINAEVFSRLNCWTDFNEFFCDI